MVGVVRSTVAQKLGVGPHAPQLRVLQLLQDEHSSAFRHEEAVAGAVEGAARPSWLVVACRGRPDQREGADRQWSDGGLNPASEGHVRTASLYQAERFADGCSPRGAGVRVAHCRTPDAELHRHVCWPRPAKHGEREHRGDRSQSLLYVALVLNLAHRYATESTAQVDCGAPESMTGVL